MSKSAFEEVAIAAPGKMLDEMIIEMLMRPHNKSTGVWSQGVHINHVAQWLAYEIVRFYPTEQEVSFSDVYKFVHQLISDESTSSEMATLFGFNSGLSDFFNKPEEATMAVLVFKGGFDMSRSNFADNKKPNVC